jgi:hypothetical protein
MIVEVFIIMEGGGMKKNVFLGCLLAFILFAVSMTGCSQGGSGATATTTTTSTTTTTIPPITSFLTIHLGYTTNEVISVLGSPVSTSTNSLFLTYNYTGILYSRYVIFSLTDYKVVAVQSNSSYSPDSIKGVVAGKTTSEVQALLGDIHGTDNSGTTYYMWNYALNNIFVEFSYSTNTVSLFGMYDPSKITLTPN